MTNLTYFRVGTNDPVRAYLETISHVLCYHFNQVIFKYSSSGKNLSDIKSKGRQRGINWYVNFYDLMLMTQFVLIV